MILIRRPLPQWNLLMEKIDMEDIAIYGAGGHCMVIIDILKSMNRLPKTIIDDHPQTDLFMGVPVLKPSKEYTNLIIAIGNCSIRKQIAQRLSSSHFIVVIHQTAIISPTAKIGDGTVVMQGAIIQSRANIGKHCIINTGASVDHECQIADFVHISPHATLCGNVRIEECSWICAGAVIVPGVHIGSNTIIGAGSVVTKDIPDNVVAYGNPCRIIRHIDMLQSNIKIV